MQMNMLDMQNNMKKIVDCPYSAYFAYEYACDMQNNMKKNSSLSIFCIFCTLAYAKYAKYAMR